MIGKEFSDEARHQWFADKEAKRDAVLKALVTETDPKIQRKLRASARRYKRERHQATHNMRSVTR